MFNLLSWPHVAFSIHVPDASWDIQEEQADAPPPPPRRLAQDPRQPASNLPTAVLGHTDEKLRAALGREKPGGGLGCVGQAGEREDLIAVYETS